MRLSQTASFRLEFEHSRCKPRLGATANEEQDTQDRKRHAEQPQHDPAGLPFTLSGAATIRTGSSGSFVQRHMIHLWFECGLIRLS